MNDLSRTVREPPSGPVQHGRWSSADEAGREGVELSDEAPILLRPVVHLRSPILDEPPRRSPPARRNDRIPLLDVIRAIGPYVVPVLIIGGPVFAVAGGGWLVITIGLTVAAILMHRVARRLTFTFAEGFLSFHQGDQWPHGVQEEYDVHYSWPSTGKQSRGKLSPSR
jgi:hypothetical protein